jgi:hypothetical protein
MARKPRAKVKVAESRVMGDEPKFNGPVTRIELAQALNWYNYFHNVKTSRKWVLNYMKDNNYTDTEISNYAKSGSNKITQTWCSIARMVTLGAEFDNNLDHHISDVVKDYKEPVKKVEVKAIKSINALIAELDIVLDSFYNNDYKPVELGDIFKGHKPTEYKEAISYYSELLQEILAIKTDKETKEGYSSLTTHKVNRYIKFLEEIVSLLKQETVTNKRRVVRKPRRKKVKTSDQLVAKLKYLHHSEELNVSSIDPAKLVDNTVLWVYNTKYRKLTKYVGDKLSVKGTTIIGFNPEQSYTKRIRKPDIIVPEVCTLAKGGLDKVVRDLKTKTSVPNGRINDQTLLLRTFK